MRRNYGEAPKGTALKGQFAAMDEGVYAFSLYPQLWLSQGENIKDFYLHREWNSVKFVDQLPEIVPNDSGIYMFVVAPHCGGLADHSYIFYVGQAVNLKSRYKDYVKEKAYEGPNPRKKVTRFLNHLEAYTYFHFTLVPRNELDKAESLLKDNLTPYANTTVPLTGRL